MEHFNSQLYEKYINLKKRKFSEIKECNKKRFSDILQYQSAMEHLMEDLKNENDSLHVEVVSMQEQYQESQSLLLHEKQRTKELSSEVRMLKEILAQKDDNIESVSIGSPSRRPSVRLEDSNECLPMKKTLDTLPGHNAVQSENVVHEISYENRLVLHDEPMNVSLPPDCCRRTKTNYGTENDGSCIPCAYHTLVELLVGMKVSVECQTEGLCFSVIHQISGYKFTLSCVRDKDGGDGELLYSVSSLGTIEGIALDWMKDDITFSWAMCPVFFDRLSRVVGLK